MNSSRRKVLVAMSGGVDSSVAALLLARQGYEVIGVSLRMFHCPEPGADRCCSEQDRADARAVCARIGIPHVTIDATKVFHEFVIHDFVEEYLAGRTPSPCIRCNRYPKIGFLVDMLGDYGAQWVATGHYARIEHGPLGPRLSRGGDASKDQSYFLYSLGTEILERLLLPLGHLTKAQVRGIAREAGLPVHHKPESQEVCFVGPGGAGSYVERVAGERLPGPGEVVDTQGNVLGVHRGYYRYTVGQRQGLGVSGRDRLYVVDVDPRRNRLVVGTREQALFSEATVKEVVWLDTQAANAILGGEILQVQARIRSRHVPARASVSGTGGDGVLVRFEEPQFGVAPGQSAVFYVGESVIGGGIIHRARVGVSDAKACHGVSQA